MAKRRRKKAKGCLTQKCRDRKKWSRAMRAATKKGGGRRVARKAGRGRGSISLPETRYPDSSWHTNRTQHPAYRAKRPSARARADAWRFAGLRRGRRSKRGLGCGCAG